MEVLLMLLCIAGLAFTIKQVDGPFDVFSKLRNLVARVPVVGPLFFHLLTCDFCLGFWASAGVYLVLNMGVWSCGEFMVWAFGGAMFNVVFCRVLNKLSMK